MFQERLQLLLKNNNYYTGPIDGILGKRTIEALDKLFKESKIDTTSWSDARKLIGGEQLLYKINGIEVGKIDGFLGPQTLYARDVYKERVLSSDNKKETWRDNENEKEIVNLPSQHKLWPREKAITQFFGATNTNQVQCRVPFTMVIAWNPTQKINSFSCHKLVKESLERIFNRTLSHYGYDKIVDLKLHLFGGCLAVRKKRGGSSYSTHSWGIAVDLDPERNQLSWGRDKAAFAKPEYDKFWEYVYDEGAISLGVERNYDWMHFQFARL